MLTEIYNWFTEGFDTTDLKGAKVLLLDELGTEILCFRPFASSSGDYPVLFW